MTKLFHQWDEDELHREMAKEARAVQHMIPKTFPKMQAPKVKRGAKISPASARQRILKIMSDGKPWNSILLSGKVGISIKDANVALRGLHAAREVARMSRHGARPVWYELPRKIETAE